MGWGVGAERKSCLHGDDPHPCDPSRLPHGTSARAAPRTELSRVSSVADAISSSNPRVIDDARARKLSNDLKRCTYYETCATYGLNVERVFQDGKWRVGGLRPRGGASAGSEKGG